MIHHFFLVCSMTSYSWVDRIPVTINPARGDSFPFFPSGQCNGYWQNWLIHLERFQCMLEIFLGIHAVALGPRRKSPISCVITFVKFLKYITLSQIWLYEVHILYSDNWQGVPKKNCAVCKYVHYVFTDRTIFLGTPCQSHWRFLVHQG